MFSDMKFLLNLYFNQKKTEKSAGTKKQEVFVKEARDQFKQLLEKGLSIPVALL